ncbi:MAG: hypothetical protein IV100_09370 [Myxococcales bacterium]|nr:hypothetical protein [Myxococcales bacterium]
MDASNDAHGVSGPVPEEMYTPEVHASALAVETAIVAGGRGTGKSFWSGVLLDESCRRVAAVAYPQLRLDRIRARAAFTGLKGQLGVDRDKLDAAVPQDASLDQARAFWWATVLRALAGDRGEPERAPAAFIGAVSPEAIDAALDEADARHAAAGTRLVIVFDAVDTVASTWPRRRLLTQALLEVIWAFRTWRHVRPKLFIRRDQLDDDAIRYVELPKLRAGAVDLKWRGVDLYGMLFTRLYASPVAEQVHRQLGDSTPLPTVVSALRSSQWPLRRSEAVQRSAMSRLAGDFMADGPHGRKKGTTWDWPLRHLSDARDEITPRAFLTLVIAAARSEGRPDLVLPPRGMRLDGMRAASRERVNQLYEEIPWIKTALAPLSGLELPVDAELVYWCWKASTTIGVIENDAKARGFLAPWSDVPSEAALTEALIQLGVMMRRSDGRLDMPDLFRVASRLLKKGATAPV